MFILFPSYKFSYRSLIKVFRGGYRLLNSRYDFGLHVSTTCTVTKMSEGPFKFTYPTARRDTEAVDIYHGVEIKDPYRWMEDTNSEEIKKFIEEQNSITRPFLDQCPAREEINKRFTELWNFPRYSCPERHAEKLYFSMNTGLQNQSVLYVQDSLTSEPIEFLDPNKLSADGTVSLHQSKFSEDGNIFAYGLSSCGSDWVTVQFKDVKSGKDYPEKLQKLKFTSLEFTHDNKGLFYGCYIDQEGITDGSETNANRNQKVYYHVVGTDQSEDVLVVEFPDEPQYIIGIDVSDCGRWLVVTPQKGCTNNLLYYVDLQSLPDGKITSTLDLVPVVTKIEADYQYVTNDGKDCVFRTNKNSPNFQLIRINLDKRDEKYWEVLVPEHEKDVLEWAIAVNGDKLLICYIRDVKNILQIHDLKTGKYLETIPLEPGTITSLSGKRKYNDIFFHFTSFLNPGTVYHCDLSADEIKPLIIREPVIKGFDPSEFITKQRFYKSKDGTSVPMYIIHKKTLVLDGNNPCILYGYGGFNVSLMPSFSISRLVFIDDLNGVYAIPNIRGGGEYGEKWHDGGRLENKQNVFDDFHAAAEYLLQEKYTSSKLLAISGGSNGGLLVAACANQRPELYRAAIANVGVMDMLKFHKFTIGSSWISDYGCSDDAKQFRVLLDYSPLHNIRIPPNPKVQYPSTLLLTAQHDDRVVPLHSLKFIATLQHTFKDHKEQVNPLLIRIETKAGHGRGKPISKVIEEVTDITCFLVRVMNLSLKSSSG